jgi:DNA repair ATPase RecN
MASVSEIREKLKEVFSEPQADMLAHVVAETRDDLVTRTDLHELTVIVKDLAEAQKRTEVQVEELAEAQKRTEVRMEELAESQKELVVAQKRTEIRVEELAEAQKELANTQNEFAQSQKELADAQKELTWAMKDTRKQMGGLALSVGYGLEAYAMERIPKILTKQLDFVEETSGPEQFPAVAGGQDDIDVVVRGTLAGRPVVFLCETKTNISPQEVRDFLPTADRVRPQLGCDDVRVFFFAYRASPEARAAVAEAGGYLAFPHTILVRPANEAA